MQVVEVVRISVLELFFHEHLLDVPGFHMFHFKDGSDSIVIDKFAEFMSVVSLSTFFERQVDGLSLIHGN